MVQKNDKGMNSEQTTNTVNPIPYGTSQALLCLSLNFAFLVSIKPNHNTGKTAINVFLYGAILAVNPPNLQIPCIKMVYPTLIFPKHHHYIPKHP